MNVTQAIKSRRSVRGYKPEPVPKAVLEKILDVAQYAPSNCNTQPWHLAVVSGAAKEKLTQLIMAEIDSGKPPNPVFPPGDSALEGVYKSRQHQCAARYYATVGIDRHDREQREKQALLNWRFFEAPHVAFLSMPKTMGVVNAVDLGIYLQTLMLLFVEHGLGSCPQGSLALYPDPVFHIAEIPEGNAIVCGISFGYEERDAVINRATTDRAPILENVSFVNRI